jgi:hypothetical protein
MHWFKKAIFCAAAGVVSVTAGAQESAKQSNAVRLGAPTRLNEPAPFAASMPASPAFQQVGAEFPPPPRVIRASLSTEDDPRHQFLPREIPPANEPKPFAPMAAPRKFERIGAPTQEADPKPNTSETTKAAAISAPGQPSGVIPARVLSETIIIVDEKGNPIADPVYTSTTRIYASGEWLLWWTRGFQLPPLVTTASPLDPERTRGALGFGTTSLLFGNNTTSAGPTSGGRFTLGYNLDPCGLCAIEGTFFFLGSKHDNATFTNPVLARPFFNLNEGHQDRELTASPGTNPGDFVSATGAIHVNTTSSFLGAEANVRTLCWCDCNWYVTGLAGFRYLNLNESLTITEKILVQKDVPAVPPNVPIFAGDQITVFDSFATRNNFYGGQVGLSGQWQTGRWSVMGSAKIAVGATVQTVDIDGGQLIVSKNGNRQSFVGGLYALNSNIGSHTQTRMSYVPEVGIKLGYDLTNNIRIFAGYDFLYWSSVLRPGYQIDQGLDVNRVPNSGGPFPPINQVRPTVPFQTSAFWAQGINAGILIRY